MIDKKTVEMLAEHALRIATEPVSSVGDSQVPGSPAVYGDELMDHALQCMVPVIEEVAGVAVHPTYSYFRVYLHGAELPPHRDREACEISVTVSLGGDPWAFWVEGRLGVSEIVMQPGDGVFYRGTECRHWRQPFAGEKAVQVFLHYVAKDGPFAEWRFDKRARLGISV